MELQVQHYKKRTLISNLSQIASQLNLKTERLLLSWWSHQLGTSHANGSLAGEYLKEILDYHLNIFVKKYHTCNRRFSTRQLSDGLVCGSTGGTYSLVEDAGTQKLAYRCDVCDRMQLLPETKFSSKRELFLGEK